MKYVVGIDEAGRGPVLGPMVYGIAAFPADKHEYLAKLGVKDSKKLSTLERERLFEQLKKEKDFVYAVRSISADEISTSMLQVNKKSLNELAFQAARDLLCDFASKYEIQEAFIDLISPAEQYEAFIRKKLPLMKLRIQAKADDTFPITGAASIVAKVTRDSQIDQSWGSGYPADPNTQNYLQTHIDQIYGFKSDNIRFSWATAQKLMDEKSKKCIWHQHERDQQKIRTGLLYRSGFALPTKK